MQRTYVYLPEELKSQINHVARLRRITKAALIREALEVGLSAKSTAPSKSSSAQALVDLSEAAQGFSGKAPKDLAQNHDKYLWN